MSHPIDEQAWQRMTAEIMSGMREWRLQHPKATLADIEAALDQHWYRLRVRMLRDVALQSSTANWQPSSAAERPTCPACGTPLILRGKRARHLKTYGGQDLTLHRSYGRCPTCKKGLFPPR